MKKYKRIVVDFETTGTDPNRDEILEVAIIDQDGNTLLHEYCKPEHITSWPQAEKIHGITAIAVKDCKPFRHFVPTVRKIIGEAEEFVAYNASFETAFLRSYGVGVTCPTVDPMLLFAPIYGEYSDYFGDYKWQRLERCAEYYGYTFHAHDAIEDVNATIFCLNRMEAAV